jgi:hypothetical protein
MPLLDFVKAVLAGGQLNGYVHGGVCANDSRYAGRWWLGSLNMKYQSLVTCNLVTNMPGLG